MTRVRYIVDDVEEATAFYVSNLGFEVKQSFAPAITILAREDLTLLVSGPKASASLPMLDGTTPSPAGGWNRFVLSYDDLANYRTTRTEPLWGSYRDYRVATCQPPGGGVVLLEMMNMLEHFDLAAMGHNSVDYVRTLAPLHWRVHQAELWERVGTITHRPEVADREPNAPDPPATSRRRLCYRRRARRDPSRAPNVRC